MVAWSKASENLLLFKVDFEKACDSFSWDYLLEIMYIIGFRSLCYCWIMELLISARASVLVNGSMTQEFQIHKGLRQGDLMSPSLFILAMESLHVSFLKAKEANVFMWISIPRTEISHFFYVNDSILLSP